MRGRGFTFLGVLLMCWLWPYLWASADKGDPVYLDENDGISLPQSATQAGRWRGYELSGNGTGHRGIEVPDSITDSWVIKWIDTNPSNSIAMYGAPSGGEVALSWLGRVTTIGDPGSDSSIPTEQAVREGLDTKEGTLSDEAGLYSALSDVTEFIETEEIDSESEFEAKLFAVIIPSEMVGANETYGSGWNADTSIPEKDDIYDWGHVFDTDDDGKVNVLDIGAGLAKTDSGGVVSAVAAPTGAVVGTTDTQTLTNKTIDGDDNTLQDIDAGSVKDILKRDGCTVGLGNGSDAITTGTKFTRAFKVPFKHDLSSITLITAENSGNITIDVWIDEGGATDGLDAITDADSLFDTASEPAISDASSDNHVEVTSFDSGEATDIVADTWYLINVDSLGTLTAISVSFEFVRKD